MYLRLAAGICLFGLLVGPTALYGQAEQNGEVHPVFADGVEASKAEEPKRAIDLLERVFVESPSHVDPDHGPVAFWLGRALAEDGYPDKARTVLRTGILLMQEKETFYPRLADAFVHRVFADRDTARYELAVDIYREMLRRAATMSDSLGSDARRVLREHVRHLRLIAPDGTQRRAGLPTGEKASFDLSSVDGSVLETWWRQEDPLPATAVNERLREHLHRVAHAREEYAHPDQTEPPLLDARGDVYVRLGEPDETVEVNYDESRLTDLIYSPGGVQVNLSDFPENEFWSYGSLDRRTYYIFVRKGIGEPFTIGTVEDLLPPQLRDGFIRGNGMTIRDQQSRGRDRAMKALATLRTIYRQYAPFHPNMATRHDDVANYMMNFGMERGDARESKYSPVDFIRRTVSSTYNRDQVAADLRAEHTPNQATSFLDGLTRPLDLATRTARFLNEDGTTRTEVYWAPEAGALVPDENQQEVLAEQGLETIKEYLVRLTAIEETADYRNRAVSRNRYRVQIDNTETATIPPQTFVVENKTSPLYHLDLQWDQYPIDARADSLGPKVQVATTREDSLRPLSKGDQSVEMSDLKPILLTGGEIPSPENAVPYPFDEISETTPLGLYFEVYNLTYGSNDRTEYTVEYTVQGKADRGALARFFRGTDQQRTVVASTNNGQQRRTEEYIRFDVEEWDLETDTDLTVTVTVTNEVTGQSTERSLEFQLSSQE